MSGDHPALSIACREELEHAEDERGDDSHPKKNLAVLAMLVTQRVEGSDRGHGK